MEHLNCNICGKKLIFRQKKYCSNGCYGKSRVGMKLSEKSKEKVRQARFKNNPVWRKEVRDKIANTLRGKPQIWHRGENCNFWKGGISTENQKIKHSLEFSIFRSDVLKRDDYTCQKCKQKGGKINVHHLKNFSQFPNLRILQENGITFCLHCHRKFHHLYGVKNNNELQVKEFLN